MPGGRPRQLAGRTGVSPPSGGLHVGSLQLVDVDRALDIGSKAFGILPVGQRPSRQANLRRAIQDRRALGVYDGEHLVARALIWSYRQWWAGRDVPMAGVAGVAVSPEYRGRGVGSLLMDAVITRGLELGYPLAVLYPASLPVYRRRGWETCGAQYRFTIEASHLRDLRGGGVFVREAGPADAARMVDLMRAQYAAGRVCGARDRSEDTMRADLDGDTVFAYLADSGFVIFGWQGPDLVVYQHLAADAETARALWAVVGSGSSVAKQVHAYLPPDDPVHALIGDNVVREVQQTRWMLRCLDSAVAVSQRGYPPGADVDIPLVLDDDQVPANRFTGWLRVADGYGELVAGDAGPGAVRLGANGLAALYAGTAASILVAAGLASGGDPGVLAALDAAFSGRPAALLEYF